MCSAVVLLEAPLGGGRTVVTDRDPSDAVEAVSYTHLTQPTKRIV